jgi:hypothetical protein
MSNDKRYTRIRFRGSVVKVEFIDEGWDGCPLFVIGHEFGPTHLIRAQHLSSAYEAWVDEQPTVSVEDLWEAFGFNSEESYKEFCLLFDQGMKEEAWAIAQADGIEGEGVSVPDDYPYVIEGYEQQSNSSGTGIVDVGHYVWVAEFEKHDWKFIGNL